MTEHVTRVDQLEAIRRLNELERVAPIYRAALERISAVEPTAAGAAWLAHRTARRALRDVDEEPT